MARPAGDAHMLMTYVVEATGEREVLWNSIQAAAPATITSRNGDTAHRELSVRDRYDPLHVPEVGDRIFVELTLQRARVRAARFIEKMIELGPSPIPGMTGQQMLEAKYATREAAVEDIARTLLELGEPDILVVTAGYIEELQEMRRGASDDAVEHLVGPEAATIATMFFDRQGQPIDMHRFHELHGDPDYLVLARTELTADVYVSTVWLGINHAFKAGPPVIFETMVFRDDRGDDCWRYYTEAEAFAGHKRVVSETMAQLKLDPHVSN